MVGMSRPLRTVAAASLAAAALAVPAAAHAAAGTVTIVDDGKITGLHVEVPVGDAVAIRFSECGPCGYRWRFVAEPAGTLVQSVAKAKPAPPSPDGPMVGASGTRTFTFTARKVGAATARLGYFGPGKKTPDRKVTVALTLTQ